MPQLQHKLGFNPDREVSEQRPGALLIWINEPTIIVASWLDKRKGGYTQNGVNVNYLRTVLPSVVEFPAGVAAVDYAWRAISEITEPNPGEGGSAQGVFGRYPLINSYLDFCGIMDADGNCIAIRDTLCMYGGAVIGADGYHSHVIDMMLWTQFRGWLAVLDERAK